MRHFRGFRGSRRRSIPRSTVRSVKYIVVSGPSTESSGIQAVTMITGTDNATPGQSSVTDVAVPTGAKVSQIEIFMPKVNLGAGTANFVTWTIQRTQSGQSVKDPLTISGNALRKNVLLSGVLGLGAGQNNNLHIKYKVPPKFQRIGDGDQWIIVTNNGLATSAFYYIIYKIFT